MKNEIENIFKERFANYESAPSADLFDKILAQKKRKKRAIWLWRAAGIGILALVSAGIVSTYTSSDTPLTSVESASEKDNSDQKNIDPKVNSQNENLVITPQNEETTIKSIKEHTPSKRSRLQDIADPSPSEITPKSSTSTSSTDYNLLEQKDNSNSSERLASLFDQIVNTSTTEGEGKYYVREVQKGTSNTFDISPKINKAETPDSEKTKEKNAPSEGSNATETDIEKAENSNTSSTDPAVSNTLANTPDTNASTPLPIRKLVALSPWRIESSIGTGLAYRALSGSSENISNRNATENARISYAAQLNGIYQWDPKWNAQIGINYSVRQENFDQYYPELTEYFTRTETRERLVIHPVFGEQLETYEVEVKDSQTLDAYNITNTNSFTSISIPLAVEYKLWNKGKWSLYTKLGLDATIYQKAEGVAMNENMPTSYSDLPYKSGSNFNTRLGVGLAYRASNRISLIAYPQATYQLRSNLSPTLGYEQRDYSIFSHFGVRIGL